MGYLTSTSWFGSGRLTVLRQVLVTGRYFLEIFLVLLCGAGLHTSESIQLGSSTNMHYLIQVCAKGRERGGERESN